MTGCKRSRSNDSMEQKPQILGRREDSGSTGRASKAPRVSSNHSKLGGPAQGRSKGAHTRKKRAQNLRSLDDPSVSNNMISDNMSEVTVGDVALLLHFHRSVLHERCGHGSSLTWESADAAASAAHILLYATRCHLPCRRSPRARQQGSKYLCTETWYLFL